ncbi:MAG TPA: hypothetical protein P5279_11830 [Anaerohalosphaeraceae bacterium]|nr:hypothetical protein [Anaerohalosphaeraceae bacterium]HRT51178.1 hypothetical protein [Anaerohalosphaeraceae bacterium]HRT87231.1 hypothetical protein [Anaerohalosphaeraceae bacterium]
MKVKIYVYAFCIVFLEAICFISLFILPFYIAGLIEHKVVALLAILLLFQPFLLFQRYRLGIPWKDILSAAIPAYLMIVVSVLREY